MVSKEEFESLYTDTITHKNYDLIVNRIGHRVTEILTSLGIYRATGSWWDYDNCSYDAEESGGYFDTERYRETIGIGGENLHFPEPWRWDYPLGIPTRWLWEKGYKKEFNARIKEFELSERKARAKKDKQKKDAKKNKEKLMKSIKSKLTKAELKLLGIK